MSLMPVINGLDVERKKPFPDIYLKAARTNVVLPIRQDCLVVEDAVNGVQAAKGGRLPAAWVLQAVSRSR